MCNFIAYFGTLFILRMRILAAMILQSRTVCGVPLSLTFDNSQDAAVFQSVVSNSTITEMVVENWHLSAGQVVILLHRCRHSRDGLRQNCLFGAIHSSAASDTLFFTARAARTSFRFSSFFVL